MGLSFNNLHVHLHAKPTMNEIHHIADIMTEGMSASRVEDSHDADVKVSVIVSAGSQWVTVLSDSIDEDLDAQLKRAKQLSDALKTQTLAVACFDSDYLCLNMVDAAKQMDLWAACGHFPYGKVPRRSNIAAWSPYVQDAAHFRQEMRRSYVCAEDCLHGIASDLLIPYEQACCLDEYGIPGSERFDFYYKVDGDIDKAPACFKLRTASTYYSFNVS